MTIKVKSLFGIFFALILLGFVSAGCVNKNSLVNTSFLPGNSFKNHPENSNVISLGDKNAADVDFGPKDISFDFKNLK